MSDDTTPQPQDPDVPEPFSFFCATCNQAYTATDFDPNDHTDHAVNELAAVGVPPVPPIEEPPTTLEGDEPAVAAEPLGDVGMSREELLAELEQRRRREAELEADLEAANEEVQARSGQADWPLFHKAEEVIAYYGRDALREKVVSNKARESKQAMQRGLPPQYAIGSEGYWADVEAGIEELAKKMVRYRTQWVSDDWNKRVKMRMVKMVKPVKVWDEDTGERWSYELRDGAQLAQLPIEAQINNAAGSIADGILKYRNKGFRVAAPFFCLLFDCWNPVPFDEGGNPVHGMLYCSQDHQSYVEGLKGLSQNAGSTGDKVLIHQAGYSGGAVNPAQFR